MSCTDFPEVATKLERNGERRMQRILGTTDHCTGQKKPAPTKAKAPKIRFIPCRMFANYRVGVIPSKAKVKFENVEEKRHPDYALLGDVLEDIKKRTSGLIAERKQLTEENARLTGRVSSP